ncbi:DUF4232 domain-containing protein [Streptomyces sp. MST-110588]|uniref:DUF4232 domain-containing protein n=1 Tax=Streptomyces sp. MST-110588 TaxID=2833628 RepID=UPI00206CC382|nr:DUF4232 domain-containing protein [Streptomyces sp. MST-110588]UNO41225.1 DUF4232 domain-containing protein [Streptomyces sp. MST-110588]
MRSLLTGTGSRTARIAASVTLAVTALSLSACQSGSDAKKTDAAPAPSAAAPDHFPSPGTESAQNVRYAQAKRDSQVPPAKNVTARATTHSTARATTCTAANAKLTVSRVTRPINHLLLTATNTGSTRCDLYAFPFLRFDDAQAPTPPVKDSTPQAVVSLEPGASGHAGIRLSSAAGEGGHGNKVRNLTVYFADRSGGSTGAPARLALPKDTHLDDSAEVTYWQTTPDDALKW